MSLTAAQVSQLIREVALRLGIDPDAPDVRAQVLNFDVTAVPTTKGLFTPVYGTVSGWITTLDGDGHHVPHQGVDKSAWTFLRAGANVNGADTTEAYMAREYTGIQYTLRVQDLSDQALEDLVQRMSNAAVPRQLRRAGHRVRHRGDRMLCAGAAPRHAQTKTGPSRYVAAKTLTL